MPSTLSMALFAGSEVLRRSIEKRAHLWERFDLRRTRFDVGAILSSMPRVLESVAEGWSDFAH